MTQIRYVVQSTAFTTNVGSDYITNELSLTSSNTQHDRTQRTLPSNWSQIHLDIFVQSHR